jgi:predicted ATP-grasp superfamily ATP-dependent carboligase
MMEQVVVIPCVLIIVMNYKTGFYKNGRQHTHVIQAFQEGTHASISCVMHKGNAEILSCNTQLVSIENKALDLKVV